MLDKKYIGHELARFAIKLDTESVRSFAESTAQMDPVHVDEAAARLFGFPSLLVPSSFFFGAERESAGAENLVDLLQIDLDKILHGEQRFSYHAMAFAGDSLTYSTRIADIFKQLGGTLESAVIETKVRNQHDVLVAELRRVILVRSTRETGGSVAE
jgi:acyl dehydratase